MNVALNAAWQSVVVDVALVLVIGIFALSSAKKGFIECFFSFFSTIAAFVLAFLLAASIAKMTGGLFGLEGAISNGLTSTFSKMKGFDIDVSKAGLQAALEGKNLPAFLVNSISKVGIDDVPQGTTLAMIAGQHLGAYATTLISFAALFIVFKILIGLIKKILNAIVEKWSLIGSLDVVLGATIGFVKGFFIVSAVIAVIAIIPSASATAFFQDCLFARWLYNSNPLHVIFGWFLR